jgi:hypothetical protein
VAVEICAILPFRTPGVCQFFAIINLEMSVQEKKRDWFDLGAKAYSQACPGICAAPTYVCPICRKPFTVEALDDGRLSKEHVPPQSVGGHELLLTCKECNQRGRTPGNDGQARPAASHQGDHRRNHCEWPASREGTAHTRSRSPSISIDQERAKNFSGSDALVPR